MWDNPRRLNATADFLIGCVALVLIAALAHLVLRSGVANVREVTLLGPLAQTDRDQIRRAANGALSGSNFLALDLDAVRRALEQVPWVRRVEVRRIWPDRLEVALEEHVALARWGDAELINTHGERFAATTSAPLPVFAGPAGAEGDIAQRYRRFSELLAPLAESPQRVTLTSRHAWQVRLQGGLHLELGRDYPGEPAERRLARFVAAFPQTLARLQRKYQYVDLRYPHGFALRISEMDG